MQNDKYENIFLDHLWQLFFIILAVVKIIIMEHLGSETSISLKVRLHLGTEILRVYLFPWMLGIYHHLAPILKVEGEGQDPSTPCSYFSLFTNTFLNIVTIKTTKMRETSMLLKQIDSNPFDHI